MYNTAAALEVEQEQVTKNDIFMSELVHLGEGFRGGGGRKDGDPDVAGTEGDTQQPRRRSIVSS